MKKLKEKMKEFFKFYNLSLFGSLLVAGILFYVIDKNVLEAFVSIALSLFLGIFFFLVFKKAKL
ncbi:MAG: hypothetical protein N3D10_03685 [Candidatus Micrarchaeota archaeon]|nr:hypothetical protein [Candidatus Micrarchaeota archaeon]